jgi:polyisoprenoid-binding protein YceI
LDLKQSAIHITFNKMKLPVSGLFKNFSGELVFDPAKPAAGHADLEVEVDSLSLRDAKLSRELRGADWLDAAQFPVARFVSSAIVTAGDDKFSVAGKLTLHGKTLNVVVPVSYTQAGQAQVFDGMLPIRREQFGVGPPSAQMADKVVLTLHLVSLPPS